MSTPARTLADRVQAQMAAARNDLAESVAFASVHGADGTDNTASAAWVAAKFTELGFDCEVIDTCDGSQAIVGFRPGPAGSRTVALYSHHDVQPAGDESLWESPPFTLTERDGRWYGRGAADCKGNLVAHLTALRAVGDEASCGVRIVVEGSEEAGGEGLEDLVRRRPELFDADLILIGDTGNIAVGVPTLTTSLRGVVNVRVQVRALAGAVHSGQFGGAAPDAMAALIAALSTLRNAHGDTVIDGLTADQTWTGAPYPAERFRRDAGVLPGVDLLGSGSPADMCWARPAVTVIGVDAPRIDECAAAIIPSAAALLNLRIPPGIDPAQAYRALTEHLRARLPWNCEMDVSSDAAGAPFAAATDGPGYAVLTAAMSQAYDGAQVVHSGQGGSIPLCTVLSEAVPDAEIALLGVEEPRCAIHAPNESVDPQELRRTALTEAILLSSY
ncbi:peptidase M20 family protein [Gordonia hirsuta DSM 44140 = NBRC 16056]|uniref:Peptidase M20 family protein n=1 Tax=Gordonia hirsuta DSM 44140 = NBRC 16056 TaxID=1121927 RepID=L7LBR0_9ACTN|nr:dipeptidase [Gordonia hirsuta]GAC58369.1 peptidase M20 family protein [Gordonia hirsuta DSM 44140 = NBRC 16056]